MPEPDAATRLRELADGDAPIVGYLGKLIPQKGVELALCAHRGLSHDTQMLVVGFGSHRERLAALVSALARGDRAAFVGDSIFDIQAAQSAGLPAIACSFGFLMQPVDELGADAVIDAFDALIPTLEGLS